MVVRAVRVVQVMVALGLTSYAKNGVATIAPYNNGFLGGPTDTSTSIPVSNGRKTVLVATHAPGDIVSLIPVPGQ